MKESPDLDEVKGRLDSLAWELLEARFPNVDVEIYYKQAEAYVDEFMRRDKRYRRNVESENPLKTLISLTMDKVASAYVLISRNTDEEMVGRLLKDFEIMVGDYLESVGLLIY